MSPENDSKWIYSSTFVNIRDNQRESGFVFMFSVWEYMSIFQKIELTEIDR